MTPLFDLSYYAEYQLNIGKINAQAIPQHYAEYQLNIGKINEQAIPQHYYCWYWSGIHI
jgi:hypothetical protein